jgi:hypothetical protein
MGAAAGYLVISRLDLPGVAMAAPLALLLAGGAMTATTLRRAALGRVPVPAFAALTMTYAVVVAFVIPKLESRKIMPDLGRWIAAHADPGDRVAIYHLNNAFRFYVNRRVDIVDTPEDAQRYFEKAPPFFCVMPETVYRELAQRDPSIRAVYWRDGVSTTSGRALWRGRTDWMRFVVVTRRPPSG